MEFTQKKLPREAASDMRLCPIGSIEPYALMLAPAYVYLRRNEKFVSIKGPLDFFTPDELAKLAPFESFFFPSFVDQALPFREAARRALKIMRVQPEYMPTPFETADATLRIMGPLWSEALSVEPFFATVFANELCSPLPGGLIMAARESDIRLFELSVLRSGIAVFFAVMLGYEHEEFLNRLRLRVFEETFARRDAIVRRRPWDEIEELISMLPECMPGLLSHAMSASELKQIDKRVARKICARLERVRGELVQPDTEPATIFGDRGFILTGGVGV